MNTNVASRVYIKLTEFLFRCLKPDVNFSIAKILIERINDFPDINIEEIAYRANTSPASVTKFCKKIGYTSFREMRTDLTYYSDTAFLSHLSEDKEPKKMFDSFLKKERETEDYIFQTLDHEQCGRIAKSLAGQKKVAIFGSTHSTANVNFFRELLSQEDLIVYELHRRSEKEIVQQILMEADSAFFISLTGEWVVQNKDFLSKETKAQKYLLTFRPETKYNHLFQDVISFGTFSFLLNSNYYSQRIFQSWIILLAISIKANK